MIDAASVRDICCIWLCHHKGTFGSAVHWAVSDPGSISKRR